MIPRKSTQYAVAAHRRNMKVSGFEAPLAGQPAER